MPPSSRVQVCASIVGTSKWLRTKWNSVGISTSLNASSGVGRISGSVESISARAREGPKGPPRRFTAWPEPFVTCLDLARVQPQSP